MSQERTALLMSHQNETVEFGSAYEKYFYLHYDKDGVFLYPEEKTTVTELSYNSAEYMRKMLEKNHWDTAVAELTKFFRKQKQCLKQPH